MGKYPVHPAAAKVPPMPEDEYAKLKERIAEVGSLIWPIIIHKGKLIDGRHRERACEELGIEPEYQHDDELLEHGGNVKLFVYDASCRRNLTPSQKSMLAADLLPEIKPKRGRPKKGTDKKPGNGAVISNGEAREQAAASAGVSPRSVTKAKNVSEKGCKQLQQAVRDGRVDVSLAEKVAKNIEGEQQEEAVAAALVSDNPAKALRDALPKPKPKPFDSDAAADAIIESLRRQFDKIPKQHRPKIFNLVNCVLKEYAQ